MIDRNADNQNTELVDNNEDMDTTSVMHADISVGTISNSENFYLRYNATNGKEVYTLFNQFKTDGVDMSKIDPLLMQKSESFFLLEKKKGTNVNLAGSIFTDQWMG